MRRDGSQNSIWQPCIHDFTPLANKSGYQVKILGNGVIAFATALLLQQEGKKCVLVTDRETQLPPTASLTTMLGYDNHPNAALMADGMRAAIDLAEEWIISSEMECELVYEPGYLFSAKPTNNIRVEKYAAEEAGLVTTMVKSIPVPMPFTDICRFEYQARINPSAFCNGLAKAFAEAGGVIIDRNAVTEKDIVADEVIVLNDVAARQRRNGYHLAFTLSSGIYPYGVAQCNDEDSYSFQLAVKDGKDYVLASLLDISPETEATAAFEKLEQTVRANFDIASIDFQWMNTYRYADDLPGDLSVQNNEVHYQHAAAGSCYFTTALLAAQVIADTVLGKENPFAVLFGSEINHLIASGA